MTINQAKSKFLFWIIGAVVFSGFIFFVTRFDLRGNKPTVLLYAREFLIGSDGLSVGQVKKTQLDLSTSVLAPSNMYTRWELIVSNDSGGICLAHLGLSKADVAGSETNLVLLDQNLNGNRVKWTPLSINYDKWSTLAKGEWDATIKVENCALFPQMTELQFTVVVK